MPGATEIVSADLSDKEQTIRAVAGSSVVYLLAGLKYDHKVWAATWPLIMANTIEACKRAGAKLIFFDNVYMYGRVNGSMTEETPFNPCSKKGEIRAKIAVSLMDEWKDGSLTAGSRFLRTTRRQWNTKYYGFRAFPQEPEGHVSRQRFTAALLHLHGGRGAGPGDAGRE
jgi:hypothetical protein